MAYILVYIRVRCNTALKAGVSTQGILMNLLKQIMCVELVNYFVNIIYKLAVAVAAIRFIFWGGW